MSDDAPTDGSGGSEAPATGLPEVDEMVTEVISVDDLAVADHVEVYERAHARLRQALDAG